VAKIVFKQQIENGVATWKHDFSEVEISVLITYVKSEQKGKIREKKEVKKEETVCLLFLQPIRF
jgi:hypothetical protein